MNLLNTSFLSTLIALVLLAIVRFARVLGRVRPAGKAGATYQAAPALLTPAERSFFGVLHQALNNDYQIFAKVRLADIVRPVRNPSRSGWQAAFNRIAGKHVDFVICDSAHLRVVGVIELDDRTHERFDRGVRDSLVDSALADAKIPILRVSARQSYSTEEIRKKVENLCHSMAQAKMKDTIDKRPELA